MKSSKNLLHLLTTIVGKLNFDCQFFNQSSISELTVTITLFRSPENSGIICQLSFQMFNDQKILELLVNYEEQAVTTDSLEMHSNENQRFPVVALTF